MLAVHRMIVRNNPPLVDSKLYRFEWNLQFWLWSLAFHRAVSSHDFHFKVENRKSHAVMSTIWAVKFLHLISFPAERSTARCRGRWWTRTTAIVRLNAMNYCKILWKFDMAWASWLIATTMFLELYNFLTKYWLFPTAISSHTSSTASHFRHIRET